MVFVNAMLVFILLQHEVLTWGSAVHAQRHDHQPPSHFLALDKAALLQFKRGIMDDPYSTLSNWNDSVDVCRFNGVQCDRTHHHRVSQLILNEGQLVGLLSPVLSNLTGLRVLWIVNSHLFGTIPHEFSSLRHLKSLRLDGNNLTGPIPDSFALLSNLTALLLLDNKLKGTLSPAFFSNWSSSLEILDVSDNYFFGEIPVEIGNCINLWSLNLYNNQFTGVLPLSLTNTSLQILDVENNGFEGELPIMIVGKLPDLVYLHLSYNKMKSQDGNTNLSPFFDALKNCTHLEELELAGMGLGGRLPDSIGQLGENLTFMLLQENNITGSIPPSISNLTLLQTLNLTSNLLNETISDEIGMLPLLEQLFLSHNCFSGPIPNVLGKFLKLGLLDLSHNQFSGGIPERLGNLSGLIYLFLNNNHLSGKIPQSIANYKELHKFDLSHNRLTGEIPPEIAGMSEIRIFINLSHNYLEGLLPAEMSKLQDVQEIDLSSNNLSGNLFPQISSCIALRLLNLSNNFLDGTLPDSLGDLKNLESLDVSRNNLSGRIPTCLKNITTLAYLNLSLNNFEGMIPFGGVFDSAKNSSFVGNPRLCGIVAGRPLPSCRHRRHLFHSRMFLIISVIMTVILALLLATCCGFCCGCIVVVSSEKVQEVIDPTSPEFIHNFPRISYRELADATEGFDDKRLIGSGSYGSVYKGVLSDGTTIAVKVLHMQSRRSINSFHRECQVLKTIRHRNVVRIITVCSFPEFKALVFPYMPNGSLDSRLYEHSSNRLSSHSSSLTLKQRVNICSDIAEGMAYLHHQSPIVVIHCDLKPSNVLLNNDMTALVSDFGISTLSTPNEAVESQENSASNMLVGSIGYIPPEYGLGSKTTTKGDVYSFGILVLEMVTGKRPTNDMFVDGLNLHNWVKNSRQENVEEVVDSPMVRASQDLSRKRKKIWEVSIKSLIELGLRCAQDSPSSRPNMLEAAIVLNQLKRDLSPWMWS